MLLKAGISDKNIIGELDEVDRPFSPEIRDNNLLNLQFSLETKMEELKAVRFVVKQGKGKMHVLILFVFAGSILSANWERNYWGVSHVYSLRLVP